MKPYDEAQSSLIDNDSYEPAYIQLANFVRRQIASGVYRPGDRLPSETELCRRFQLSRMTVRRGVEVLVDQGIVSTSQGRGTFVKPWALSGATFHLQQLHSIFSDRHEATVKLLEARIVRADARVARKLTIAEGRKVIYIRRLLYQEGEPAIYHREYLIYDPARPIVEAEMEATSLRGFFDGSDGTGLQRGELTVELAMLDDDETLLLRSPVPAAFLVEHVFFDFDDRPASWGWFLCRGDRLRFVTSVGIQAQS